MRLLLLKRSTNRSWEKVNKKLRTIRGLVRAPPGLLDRDLQFGEVFARLSCTLDIPNGQRVMTARVHGQVQIKQRSNKCFSRQGINLTRMTGTPWN